MSSNRRIPNQFAQHGTATLFACCALVAAIVSPTHAQGREFWNFDMGHFVIDNTSNPPTLESFFVNPTGNCSGASLSLGGNGDYWCEPTNGFFDCGPAVGGLPRNEHSALDRINLVPQPNGMKQVFFDVYCSGDDGETLTDFGQATAHKTDCSPSSTSLCLNDGRFRADIEWSNQFTNGPRAAMSGGLLGGGDTGIFYFDDPSNVEFVIKALDACSFNNHFWIYSAAATDVEYTLTVTDTQTNHSKTYTNPLGQAAEAITDTSAFATCP